MADQEHPQVDLEDCIMIICTGNKIDIIYFPDP
jgi:hypothetical protein